MIRAHGKLVKNQGTGVGFAVLHCVRALVGEPVCKQQKGRAGVRTLPPLCLRTSNVLPRNQGSVLAYGHEQPSTVGEKMEAAGCFTRRSLRLYPPPPV